jgi:hypothetical protein
MSSCAPSAMCQRTRPASSSGMSDHDDDGAITCADAEKTIAHESGLRSEETPRTKGPKPKQQRRRWRRQHAGNSSNTSRVRSPARER